MEAVWRRLPEQLVDCVLSFLPVPALFRCRSVCRRWNRLLRKPSFLELCDRNARNKMYLFVMHHVNMAGFMGNLLNGTYRKWTCVLDLEEGRWYKIPVNGSVVTPSRNIPRRLAMNDGLICELSQLPDSPVKYSLVVFDPVANMRWPLPVRSRQEDSDFPIVVLGVDVDCRLRRSFNVFIMDQNSIFMNKPSGFFVYESFTNAWRALKNPPLELGYGVGESTGRRLEESAVFFQGNLYMTFWYYNVRYPRIVILSYNLEKDLWSEVYAVKSKNPGNPQLIVDGTRLFLSAWVDALRPEGLGFPQSMFNYSELQVTEILVQRNSSRTVMNVTKDEVKQICGKSQTGLLRGLPLLCNNDISFAFPPIPNEDRFLVMVSDSTGTVIFYDMLEGTVKKFPAHPSHSLHQRFFKREKAQILQDGVVEEEDISSSFSAKLITLSMRSILSD